MKKTLSLFLAALMVFTSLFADMQEEMMTNGFLAQMMESIEKAQTQEKKKTPSKAKTKN